MKVRVRWCPLESSSVVFQESGICTASPVASPSGRAVAEGSLSRKASVAGGREDSTQTASELGNGPDIPAILS